MATDWTGTQGKSIKSVVAKVGGWLQFATVAASQLATQGTPHGFAGWAVLIGSLLGAVGIHAASNTDGKN